MAAQNIKVLISTLRVVSIAFLVFVFIKFGLIIDSSVFNFWEILRVFGQIRDLLNFLFYIIIFLVFYGLLVMFGGIFSTFRSGFDYGYYHQLNMTFFNHVIARWFHFSNLETASPTIGQAVTGLGNLLKTMGADWYLLILQICIMFSFYFALHASITSDTSSSIKVIAIMNLIIVVPLFFIHLEGVLLIFGKSNLSWLDSILNQDLLNESIFIDVPNNFGTFITSDIFTVAILSFMYLEITFQLSYIDKVSTPTLEREMRLGHRIENINKDAQMAIKKLELLKQTQQARRYKGKTIAQMQEEMEEKKKLSLQTFMSDKNEGGGFNFISELIKKKKFEKEEKKQMDAMKDTRKVAAFLEKLFSQDPEAKASLTARSAAPRASHLLTSTISNMITRFILITLLTWACVHPAIVFGSIFNSPDAIMNSVEMQTHEAVLSLFVPILLTIPLISTVIKVTKQNKVRDMLRGEDIKRSGLSEEDYDKLQKERYESRFKKMKKKKNVGDISMQRDQDAITAAEAKN